MTRFKESLEERQRKMQERTRIPSLTAEDIERLYGAWWMDAKVGMTFKDYLLKYLKEKA